MGELPIGPLSKQRYGTRIHWTLPFPKLCITFPRKIPRPTCGMGDVAWPLIPMTIPCFWWAPMKAWFTNALRNTVPDFWKRIRLIIRPSTTLLGILTCPVFSWLVPPNGWSRFGITIPQSLCLCLTSTHKLGILLGRLIPAQFLPLLLLMAKYMSLICM